MFLVFICTSVIHRSCRARQYMATRRCWHTIGRFRASLHSNVSQSTWEHVCHWCPLDHQSICEGEGGYGSRDNPGHEDNLSVIRPKGQIWWTVVAACNGLVKLFKRRKMAAALMDVHENARRRVFAWIWKRGVWQWYNEIVSYKKHWK